MGYAGILIGFYSAPKDAEEALLRLRRNGFRRTALITKTAGGGVRRDVVTPGRWAVRGAATGFAFGFLIAYFASRYYGGFTRAYGIAALCVFTALGPIGALLAVRGLKLCISGGVVKKYAGWLVSDETAVIAQAPPEALAAALGHLRSGSESQPAVFAFHPRRKKEPAPEPERVDPLTAAQLSERARQTAGSHRIKTSRGRNAPLLDQVAESQREIALCRRELEEASQLEQLVSPSSEWILDNFHIIKANTDSILLNLPKQFYSELPTLDSGPMAGMPRIYGLADDLVTHTDGQLDRHIIESYLSGYQAGEQLRIGELWAAPVMLRIALSAVIRRLADQMGQWMREREAADFWANRLLAVSRRDPDNIFFFLAELAKEQPEPSEHFASHLFGRLFGETAALEHVKSWLERKPVGEPGDSASREQTRQAAHVVSIGNAISSLRRLSLLDWREVFEGQCFVEKTLRQDPAEIYGRMDFATRDKYRHAVEELALGGDVSEQTAAEAAITLAYSEDTARDPRLTHVGYYLIGEGRPVLAEQLGCQEGRRHRALLWTYSNHTAIYISSILLLTSAAAAVALTLAVDVMPGLAAWAIAALAALPASQLATQIVNYFVTRLLPPRVLPKMSFEETGIPDEYRTLVVVPMMLSGEATAREEIDKLEIRYLANPDANLLFSLFSDYTGSDTVHADGDEELLKAAMDGIQALNERYGAGRFFLFHRDRVWTESEQSYIGWERKRGKLECLNALLNGDSRPGGQDIVRVGDADSLVNARFVITLDSDTQLPRDAARRMIETISHPLNRPPFDAEAPYAYTIIQPRVSSSLPSATATAFSRLFTDPVGTDPYTKAVSDVYQDLSGEGSYIGKGIYDPRAFHRVLKGRFPEQRILSHDLIEGAHLRVGFVSDIELFDEFPRDYFTYANREHRWIRGDWQIADWCTPRVPDGEGKRVGNPLGGMNRWKIFDNLRRSLVPGATVALLVASWMIDWAPGFAACLLAAAVSFFPIFTELIARFATKRGTEPSSWRELTHCAARCCVELSFMPHRGAIAVDAIARVFWRRLVSHRKTLEWATAHAVQKDSSARLRPLLAQLGAVSLASVGAGVAVWHYCPKNLPYALPFLVLWAACPWFGWRLSAVESRDRREPLAAEDTELLRNTARRTWRYFRDFAGENSSWLPPDNYQISYGKCIAMRTSPTNIGLNLLCNLTAHDFGYLTCDDVIERTSESFKTIKQLERYNGHLLNWYDLKTLAPLGSKYISMVDSGNLLGCLWTLDSGIEELLDEPVIGPRALDGLFDTLGALREALHKGNRIEECKQMLEHLEGRFGGGEETPGGIMARIREAEGPAGLLAQAVRENAPAGDDAAYWARQVEEMLSGWRILMDRYLPWMEILAGETRESMAATGMEDLEPRRLEALERAPSMREIAAGDVPAALAILGAGGSEGITARAEWLQRLDDAFSRSKWMAAEMLARAEGLHGDTRELADGMNMSFLYDADRRLFSIGYNLNEQRLDTSHYDLLASEARLGSLVAIARGDVPGKHWLAMSRPYGWVGGRRVLLSWTGTMFEYLMPLLFQKTYENSLLDQACRAAVASQIDYGKQRGAPWGISESAYSDVDANRTYQYRAFGAPGLGLKRNLGDDLVVAPYATMLALAVAPREAVKNLRRLSRLGMYGDYGFYEAIDFARDRSREGERGVIVDAYMAHHQAMGFLAVGNLLNDNATQRRFHKDPRVRASEPLFYERVPVSPPLYQGSERDRKPSGLMAEEIAPSTSSFNTPHSKYPKTHILSNGRYSLMVTNSGGGYSRWGDFDITRWRADSTRDNWGSFCYFRDMETGRVWSNSYQPVGGEIDNYAVNFTLDHADIRRSDFGIETETVVIVAPEDDAEIRRISLINRSGRPCEIELTSYVELSLAAHNADLQHPAFNKLFVKTEAEAKSGALIASRRNDNPGAAQIWAGHLICCEDDTPQKPQFETDRRRFIGRGRSTANPVGAGAVLSNSQGSTLDPIFSLRRRISLEPGGRFDFSLVLCAASSREGVLGLIEKYSDPHSVSRELDMAWSHAQLELRHLRIQPDDARRFQELANSMIYPNPQLRLWGELLKQNKLGQPRLWQYGISGDLPIAVVVIGENMATDLTRQALQALQAHTYWRLHGLKADLVILNEEAGSYEQPLNEQLKRLIQSHSMSTGIDIPGGVFLRSADQMPAEDMTLILAAARVALVAARGPLPQQLSVPPEVVRLPAAHAAKFVDEEPSAPLPFMELPYFNGLGGFTTDGREYAIYLGPGQQTPAPWVNVIANPKFGTLVSESGAGFTWYGNSQQNRLTGWSNDPVSDPPSEAVYIRDEESGKYWSPTAAPVRERDAYRARHGAGYTVFEHNSHAIEQELTVFVPVDDGGGDPVCIRKLRLRNDSSRERKLSVTFFAEWTLGEQRENMQAHIFTEWDRASKAVFARNHYRQDYGSRVAFAAMSPAAQTWTGDRSEFIGRNGSLAAPAALGRVVLSCRTGTGLDPCAGLQVKVNLSPGESADVFCLLGEAGSAEEAAALIKKYSYAKTAIESLSNTVKWWDKTLGAVSVETPSLSVNMLLNRWLVYQTLSCRLWGRSGFYQSGGAYGFRDQLQDVMSLLHSAPGIAREHILRAASRQFRDGDVQHWWHPQSGAGVRTRCSDDMLWLPYVTANYVRVTGDVKILQEDVGFLEGRRLEDGEHEVYGNPVESKEGATLYEHCRLAVERGMTAGAHGLPLMGIGDWNDGMNRVGVDGKGESVWLAWFLVDVLKKFAELTEIAGGAEEFAAPYLEKAKALAAAIEKSAWDGDWYMRAWFDDGTPLGSSKNEEARIDSLPQSWATLSGAGDSKRAGLALESAYKQLVLEDEKIVLLFAPPFDKSAMAPGYIKNYPPGVRENGGQYTHGAIWLAMAFARAGDGDRSAKLLGMMNPVEHAREPESAGLYAVEPYVVAADVYRLPGMVGRGGWTWYTGAAGWMYRAWIEEVIGLKVCGDRLVIDPALPSKWDRVVIRYRHGKAVYEITIENPDGVSRGVAWIDMDGLRLKGNEIGLEEELIKRRVTVRLGAAVAAKPEVVPAEI